MRTVGILNSVTLPRQPGRATERVQGYLRGLEESGWREGDNLRVVMEDVTSRRQTARLARRFEAEGVDLIHATGTGLAATAASQVEIPIVYYGSHPQDIGRRECAAPQIAGIELVVPLTRHYKNFRFIRHLLPRVRVVWVPFYADTIFVSRQIREHYRQASKKAGRPVWLSGETRPLCFPEIAGLAYIVGLHYRELVYSTTADLKKALKQVDPKTGVLMPYSEPYSSPGGPEAILEFSRSHRVPLIWNNNPQITQLGGLCGIGVDFERLGRETGRISGAVLGGAAPAQIERGFHTSKVAWINLDTARELDLELSADILSYFDRTIENPEGRGRARWRSEGRRLEGF